MAGKTAEEISQYLPDHVKIAVTPGKMFGAFGEDYIRTSCANAYETLEKAMENIRTALENYKISQLINDETMLWF